MKKSKFLTTNVLGISVSVVASSANVSGQIILIPPPTPTPAPTPAPLQGLLIEESFDLAVGTDVVGSNGGIGFAAPFTGITAAGAGTSNVDVAAGFTFGDLETSGGALSRTNRAGRGTISRAVDPAVAAALTADDSTIYFSVILDPTDATLAGAVAGQPVNTFATLTFGSEGLTDASIGTENGTGTDIANSGDAIGVGFVGGTAFGGVAVQGVTFDGGTIAQSDTNLIIGDTQSLIVGRIDFAANGTADTISLFNVTDNVTSIFLEEESTPFSVQTLDVDQSAFDTISISDGQTSGFDEIRFGTDLESVLPGFTVTIPEPASISLLALSSLALLRRRRA